MIILRNIGAVVAGVAVAQLVNMALIVLGQHVISPPVRVDFTDAQSLSKSMHMLKPEHFVFPFLAHALGTLAGALAAFLIAASHRSASAYLVGAVSLAGGIVAASLIPAPLWFIILDLVVAYVPMAWIGAQTGNRIHTGTRR